MSRILVFGGHGKVALLLAPLLVEAGHQVTAVVRNPDHTADVAQAGADARVADIEQLDVAALAALVSDHDAIVWTAGAGGGDPSRTYAVDRDAAIRSMDAAVEAGVRRYIMVSYFGAGPDHGVPEDNSFYPYAESKSAADAHLRDAPLDATILGPSALTLDSPTGKIDTDAPDAASVSRADVAAVIAATLADDTTIGRTIRFNTGATPIPEAIHD
ncbi:SDR family oxidoreductase [Microbacterium sp. LRZ72]|uniref:SDR family oxidoreductase n=1 Tax=Microbacterium sp. LRZ72 TaxID=2942481 RepID=UPI0029A2789B|nr:SDR family oxidoreductase [Microbacterium sp. LRZ72]MDX2375229.1 SDR family oxidoreductase [Microbacterium sp. LRZ72]